jgi:hypothetical protein
MTVKRITKVAGAGLVGFLAISVAADKMNAAQHVAQIAGFVGAFLGSLAAGRQQQPPQDPNDARIDESEDA